MPEIGSLPGPPPAQLWGEGSVDRGPELHTRSRHSCSSARLLALHSTRYSLCM